MLKRAQWIARFRVCSFVFIAFAAQAVVANACIQTFESLKREECNYEDVLNDYPSQQDYIAACFEHNVIRNTCPFPVMVSWCFGQKDACNNIGEPYYGPMEAGAQYAIGGPKSEYGGFWVRNCQYDPTKNGCK